MKGTLGQPTTQVASQVMQREDMTATILGYVGRAAWTLAGSPGSVDRFRRMARAMAADGRQAESAALCVSELVTNALLHTRSGLPGGTVTVCFDTEAGGGGLSILVRDDGVTDSVPERADTGLPGPDEFGYGLTIVAGVSAGWGVVRSADGRRVTWCIIPANLE